jgi:hypothetical protein
MSPLQLLVHLFVRGIAAVVFGDVRVVGAANWAFRGDKAEAALLDRDRRDGWRLPEL